MATLAGGRHTACDCYTARVARGQHTACACYTATVAGGRHTACACYARLRLRLALISRGAVTIGTFGLTVKLGSATFEFLFSTVPKSTKSIGGAPEGRQCAPLLGRRLSTPL